MEEVKSKQCDSCRKELSIEMFNKRKRKVPRWDFDTKKYIHEMIPTHNCINCSKIINEEKYHKIQRQKYKHLWIREDGSTITDPYEIVDDKRLHLCRICMDMKPVAEYKVVGKYNPRLIKTCNVCLEAQKVEREQRKNGALPRLEWKWNGITCIRSEDGEMTHYSY